MTRALRTALVLITWPVVAVYDRIHGVNPPARLRTGLDWARDPQPTQDPVAASKPQEVSQ